MPLDYRQDKRYSHLSQEQVRQHFETERELREVLLNTPREERPAKFTWAYDELFRRVPWHPALTEVSGVENTALVKQRLQSIIPLLPDPDDKVVNVLEVGCGMGELSIALSQSNFQCVGLDVSEIRISRLQHYETDKLKFQHAEASSLPFQSNEFDAVISMQLFEHLHPEDAVVHLQEVNRVLKPGGYCLLETPNRWVGPGDVSRFFSDIPLGFHLREYSISELGKLFLENNYKPVEIILRKRRVYPLIVAVTLERLWRMLPKEFRHRRHFGMNNPFYRAFKPN